MAKDVKIELARCNDANKIAELSRSEIEYGFRWKWTPPLVSSAIANRQTNVAVARANGKMHKQFSQVLKPKQHLKIIG